MAYIRTHYRVPAKRGAKVRYTAPRDGEVMTGVIVGSLGQYLRVRVEPFAKIMTFHPTWNLEYLP